LLDTNLESWNYNLGFHTMYGIFTKLC
jgi:hypothetical protein